ATVEKRSSACPSIIQSGIPLFSAKYDKTPLKIIISRLSDRAFHMFKRPFYLLFWIISQTDKFFKFFIL
ncbi:MAG: hypothetical protein ACLS9A_02465, partial [Clostridia bacterium]